MSDFLNWSDRWTLRVKSLKPVLLHALLFTPDDSHSHPYNVEAVRSTLASLSEGDQDVFCRQS